MNKSQNCSNKSQPLSIIIFAAKKKVRKKENQQKLAQLCSSLPENARIFLISPDKNKIQLNNVTFLNAATFAEGLRNVLRISQTEKFIIGDISECNLLKNFSFSEECLKEADLIKLPPSKKFAARVLNKILSRVCSLKFSNITGSIILCKRECIESLGDFIYTDERFYFEILCRAYGHGFKIKIHEGGKINSPFPSAKIAAKFLLNLFRLWRLRNTVYFADYDERAFNSIIPIQRIWQRTRFKMATEMESYAESLRNSQNEQCEGLIIDVGCGSGPLILSRKDIIGIDMSIKKIRYLKNYRQKENLLSASCQKLPFRDNTAKLLYSCEVIEHVPDKEKTIAELSRVVRPGGYMILTTPDYGRPVWPFIEKIYEKLMPGAYASEHISRFTLAELREICAKYNMELVRHKTMFASIIIALFRKKI